MHLDPQIQELGYEFRDLLIQTESGEIAPKVSDIGILLVVYVLVWPDTSLGVYM